MLGCWLVTALDSVCTYIDDMTTMATTITSKGYGGVVVTLKLSSKWHEPEFKYVLFYFLQFSCYHQDFIITFFLSLSSSPTHGRFLWLLRWRSDECYWNSHKASKCAYFRLFWLFDYYVPWCYTTRKGAESILPRFNWVVIYSFVHQFYGTGTLGIFSLSSFAICMHIINSLRRDKFEWRNATIAVCDYILLSRFLWWNSSSKHFSLLQEQESELLHV